MSLPTPPMHQVEEQQLPRQTPGWQALTAAAIQAWLVLGLIGFGGGIIWRVTGIGPGIFELLNGLGIAYWLVPLLLIGGWEKMRDRQTRHFTRGSGIYGLAFANAMKLWGYLLLVSLAPLGLFTPFNRANAAVRVITDMFDLQFGYPEFVLVTLLCSGTIVLCFSLVCLLGTRRILGPGFGLVAWGMVGTALNSSVVTGNNIGSYNLSFTGLAEYARSALNSGWVDPAQVGYVTDSVRLVYGVLLAVMLVGIGLLVVLQTPYNRQRTKLDSYLLPALVGMLVPAVYTFAHTSSWVKDPALAYPLPWLSLFMVGLIPLLAVYTVVAWSQENPPRARLDLAGLLLLWLCPLAWVAFAQPVVSTGQVGKPQLALACTICMLLVFLWVKLSNYLANIRPANPVGRSIILATLLSILVVPLTGSQYSGIALLFVDAATLSEGNQMLVAAWVSSLVVTALGIAVWLRGRRVRTKRNANEA